MKDIHETTANQQRLEPVEPQELAEVAGGGRSFGGRFSYVDEPVDTPTFEPPGRLSANRCETFLGQPADGEEPALRPVDEDELAEVEGGIQWYGDQTRLPRWNPIPPTSTYEVGPLG